MRLDATKSKEKGLFVSSYPMPYFKFPVHIKTLTPKALRQPKRPFADFGQRVLNAISSQGT